MSTYLASSKSPCGIGRIPWRTAAGAGLGGGRSTSTRPTANKCHTSGNEAALQPVQCASDAETSPTQVQRKPGNGIGGDTLICSQGERAGQGVKDIGVWRWNISFSCQRCIYKKKHLGTGQCHTRGRPLNPNKWNETEAPSGSAAPPPAFHCREEFGGGTHPSSGSAMFN